MRELPVYLLWFVGFIVVLSKCASNKYKFIQLVLI